MEKTNNGIVIPLKAGWNDMGNWYAVWESSEKDNNGNFFKGKTILKNSTNCYVLGENRLIVGMGLENLVVVDTSDAILVMHQNFAQEVKNVVNDLK